MAQESHISDDWFVGEAKAFPFTIYQEDATGVVTTTPQDITGWALRWDLRRSDSEADPVVLTKAIGTGISITNGPLGQGTITLVATDAAALQPRIYRHALKRTDAGSETVLFVGNAVLKKATTR
jgi:hypothetical protein